MATEGAVETSFGKYVLQQRLAAGGMGEVYAAEQTGPGGFRKRVAVKLMLPDFASEPKYVQLFLTEARLAARLHHPNVVQVFDVGAVDDKYFIAMELIDGLSLGALIKRLRAGSRWLSGDALNLVARGVLQALQHAHEQRDADGRPLEVVHRDVSPSNVLVSRDGQVKLTDFGIAKARDSETYTQPGEVRGKLAYLAPEVLTGASASPRSDLYALGVTLYRLAALTSPFGGEQEPLSVLDRKVVPLATLRADLSPQLIACIEKALAPTPTARHATAAAMLAALPAVDAAAAQRLLAAEVSASLEAPGAPVPAAARPATAALVVGEPAAPAATPPPAPRPARRWPRAQVVALALALMAAGVWAGWRWAPQKAPAPEPLAAAPVVAPREEPPVERPPPPPAPRDEEPEVDAPPPASEPEAPRPGERPRRAKGGKLSPPARLSVQASPWAFIELNGQRIGQTPLSEILVTTPSVRLRLYNPDFEPIERQLTFTPGKHVKIHEHLKANR